MAEEQTRLDLKIARDRLLSDIDPAWDALRSAVETTCGKLYAAYGYEFDIKMTDQNSVISAIKVKRSEPVPGENSSIERTLEMRLIRQEKKVFTKVTERHSRRQEEEVQHRSHEYEIAANPVAGALYFTSDDSRFSAIELAEHEIAEHLMKLEL